MVLTHTMSVGRGSNSQLCERSGRLSMNAAMAARMPVASAATMLTMNTGWRKCSARSDRTP